MEYEISFLSWDSRYFWSGALNEYSTDVVVKKLQLPIPNAMKASIMLLDQKILKLDFMGAVKVTIFELLVA